MKVIRHHLKSYQLNLWLTDSNLIPASLHSPSQFVQFHPRGIGAIQGSIAASHNLAEKRAAAFSHHRHHIHHAVGVVMIYTPTKHGRLLFASKCLLTLIHFTFHTSVRPSNQIPLLSLNNAKLRLSEERTKLFLRFNQKKLCGSKVSLYFCILNNQNLYRCHITTDYVSRL